MRLVVQLAVFRVFEVLLGADRAEHFASVGAPLAFRRCH